MMFDIVAARVVNAGCERSIEEGRTRGLGFSDVRLLQVMTMKAYLVSNHVYVRIQYFPFRPSEQTGGDNDDIESTCVL